MFKVMSVLMPRPTQKAENSFRRFAVAVPANLLPVLERRVFAVIYNKCAATAQPHDLTYEELMVLDALVERHYPDPDACNMLLNGHEFSLLTRFLNMERLLIDEIRWSIVSPMTNAQYWGLITIFQVAMKQPTYLVKLSFLG